MVLSFNVYSCHEETDSKRCYLSNAAKSGSRGDDSVRLYGHCLRLRHLILPSLDSMELDTCLD